MIKKIINFSKIAINYIVGSDCKTNPILLEIEPTNNCNLRCVMCPNKKMVRERGYMDLSVFKKIVDQTVSTVWEYSFGMVGEPTIHPDFIEMVEYAKSKGGKVAVYTNMNYKNDMISERLVKSSIDRIVVNMCTIDAGIYNAVTEKGDYNTFIHNLVKIREDKKKFKKKTPTIVGSFLKMNLNIGDLKKEKEQFKKYFDYYMVLEMHDWAGDKSVASLKSTGRSSWFKRRCSNLRTTAVVLWDGRITACCYDYEGKVIFGDVKSEKIYDIWNSPEAKRFRRRHRDSDLCKFCEEKMRFQFSINNLYNYFRINLVLKN